MKVKFTIDCEMEERWAPFFLGMLRTMQMLGKLGGSRWLKFYSDGDGDFRPNFILKTAIKPSAGKWVKGDATFNAG